MPVPTSGASHRGRTAHCGSPITSGRFGRITTDGVISKFNTPSGSFPVGILTGPDGALWFTESDVRRIGRITTAGVISEFFSVPTAGSTGTGPLGVTTGPDGALWFTESFDAGQIARCALTTTNSHDFNADAKSDIAWRDTSGNVAIWEMNGTTVLNPDTAGGAQLPPPPPPPP